MLDLKSASKITPVCIRRCSVVV